MAGARDHSATPAAHVRAYLCHRVGRAHQGLGARRVLGLAYRGVSSQLPGGRIEVVRVLAGSAEPR